MSGTNTAFGHSPQSIQMSTATETIEEEDYEEEVVFQEEVKQPTQESSTDAPTRQHPSLPPSDQNTGMESSKDHLTRNNRSRSFIGATSIIRTRDVNQYRQELRNIIWPNPQSLMGSIGYRQRMWIHTSRTFVAQPQQSDKFRMLKWIRTEISSAARDEIKKLLDQSETYKKFLIQGSKNPESVRLRLGRILRAYVAANDNQFPLNGPLPLCTVLTTINKRDQDVFYLMQILTKLMQPYFANNHKLIRDEILLLIELLCYKEKELVEHLNYLRVDSMDLCDVFRSWIQTLFVDHFYVEFVYRVIDLVLLEGPSVLISLVYGILIVLKGKICSKTYDGEVFELLNKVPKVLRHPAVAEEVLKEARVIYSLDMYEFVKIQRQKKWSETCLRLPRIPEEPPQVSSFETKMQGSIETVFVEIRDSDQIFVI